MLKEKTESMVKETKDLMDQFIGTMFIEKGVSIFDVGNSDNDDTSMKMMLQCIRLSNQCFDLAVAQAEQLDSMNKKLDELLKIKEKSE